MYNWSPNCCRLLSKITSMSFLELARDAIDARRIAILSPTPAPEESVSHIISCFFRKSWLPSTWLINPAAADIISASALHQLGLSSDMTIAEKNSFEMSCRILWIKFRCSKLARPLRSFSNLTGSFWWLIKRTLTSSLIILSSSCQLIIRFNVDRPYKYIQGAEIY